MEFAALTLLLGVLCYAFYDSNVKGSEQNIVLTSELFSMREVRSKEDITLEMLSLSTEELLNEQKEEELSTVKMIGICSLLGFIDFLSFIHLIK